MADKLYYLGAGASANSIPVIAQLKNRVKEIEIYLDGLYKTNTHSKAIELRERIDEISSCFKV
jgi:hypothetical protein